jgi:hypothetical protein
MELGCPIPDPYVLEEGKVPKNAVILPRIEDAHKLLAYAVSQVGPGDVEYVAVRRIVEEKLRRLSPVGSPTMSWDGAAAWVMLEAGWSTTWTPGQVPFDISWQRVSLRMARRAAAKDVLPGSSPQSRFRRWWSLIKLRWRGGKVPEASGFH